MKFLAISSIAALLVAQQVAAYPFIEGCLQNHTVTAVDSCTSIAAQFKITEAEFYAMNPGLHHSAQHDCDNLDSGKNYCVCLKAPCPVANAAVSVAPAASAAANVTASVSAAASSAIASISSSLVPSLSASAKPSVSPSASASVSASSPVSSVKNSATTTSITAITVAFAMTATTAMLF